MAAYGDSLDMSLFFGTEDEKKMFCDSLLRLLKERGCVKVRNHSIPDEDVHELFRQASNFSSFWARTRANLPSIGPEVFQPAH